jgi:hypothetical protein
MFLTEEILLTKGAYGESIFHIVAENRHYGNIQDNQWTRAVMPLEADNGTTPLHHICASNCGLVSEDITLDDMLAQTDAGSTPLHKWAASNRWYKIPDRFLTKEALELEVDFGESPLLLMSEAYEFSNQTPLTQAQKKRLERAVKIGIRIMPKFLVKPNPNKR